MNRTTKTRATLRLIESMLPEAKPEVRAFGVQPVLEPEPEPFYLCKMSAHPPRKTRWW